MNLFQIPEKANLVRDIFELDLEFFLWWVHWGLIITIIQTVAVNCLHIWDFHYSSIELRVFKFALKLFFNFSFRGKTCRTMLYRMSFSWCSSHLYPGISLNNFLKLLNNSTSLTKEILTMMVFRYLAFKFALIVNMILFLPILFSFCFSFY